MSGCSAAGHGGRRAAWQRLPLLGGAGEQSAGGLSCVADEPPSCPEPNRLSYSPVCTDPATIRNGVDEGRHMVQPVARALLEGQRRAHQAAAAAAAAAAAVDGEAARRLPPLL